MSFLPRFPAGEFAPIFRLLDDYDAHRSTRGNTFSSVRSWAPKFDVKETSDAYQLDGELPGIEQKDIHIEFTDAHTLVVKGRTERSYSSSSPSEEPTASGDLTEGTETPKSHKATVEDEQPEGTPAATESGPEQAVEKAETQEVASPRAPSPKYWVSERSVGEFHRTFSFPSRVNQDAVKASLKNGILSVVVPKSTAPTSKRITVE